MRIDVAHAHRLDAAAACRADAVDSVALGRLRDQTGIISIGSTQLLARGNLLLRPGRTTARPTGPPTDTGKVATANVPTGRRRRVTEVRPQGLMWIDATSKKRAMLRPAKPNDGSATRRRQVTEVRADVTNGRPLDGEDDGKTNDSADEGTGEKPNQGEAATAAFHGWARTARDACFRQRFWMSRNAWGAAESATAMPVEMAALPLSSASGGKALGAAESAAGLPWRRRRCHTASGGTSEGFSRGGWDWQRSFGPRCPTETAARRVADGEDDGKTNAPIDEGTAREMPNRGEETGCFWRGGRGLNDGRAFTRTRSGLELVTIPAPQEVGQIAAGGGKQRRRLTSARRAETCLDIDFKNQDFMNKSSCFRLRMQQSTVWTGTARPFVGEKEREHLQIGDAPPDVLDQYGALHDHQGNGSVLKSRRQLNPDFCGVSDCPEHCYELNMASGSLDGHP
ncbi:hypothetical protein THAOC_08931 [Thalassiosira oceanica]|uniref:Uncharacterized protein n=1 Tax=Thalassiosira oceanica TaxID=159749 RepID=K0T8T9_THAOC|nr:hypothetical protein THAOC_08931 [Thalassiosira oceanica]|eukprot:EJK69776.1 hypothetical protein THAOC_08931 [Thalassiosira oceanica]